MKFFYINNSFCTECNRCVGVCPTGAICVDGEKRYINHDKCTSCGSCMKACNDDAVEFESVGQIVERMEQADNYHARVVRLEKELTQVRERLRLIEESFDKVVMLLPIAALVMERSGKIIVANQHLVDMAGIDDLRLSNMQANLAGENISGILKGDPVQLMKMSTMEGNENIAEVNGLRVSISIAPLAGDVLFCIVRDLRDKNIAADKILELLRDSIDRKMAMVQKIGSLLGEETTTEINNINAAIKIIEGSSEENEQ